MAHFLPGISGLATIDPGLNVLDTPILLPVSIDLFLVPVLFLFLYITVILIDAIRRHRPIARSICQRVGAVLSGAFFLLLCVAIGGLISYVLLEQLPGRIQNSISSVGMNADIHLLFLGYKTNSLHGNILTLLGLLIGIGIFIAKIKREPESQRSIPLTREQRMTPYQRMLQDRRNPLHQPFVPETADYHATPPILNTPAIIPEHTHVFTRQENPPILSVPPPVPLRTENTATRCHNEPLLSLLPEAVNYRPLG